ncbi:esterase/lipase family protein [Nocardia alba]|uniref:Lipase (Class 2) n=1 Tax=Nocardia alba TaxID=225051 RepID=A0A4R1FD09_9NOCA|nr:alpha/beta fold hydrolase [Nocardia alba]TCJ89738.1 lipase (class 2) [Nocardia alba]
MSGWPARIAVSVAAIVSLSNPSPAVAEPEPAPSYSYLGGLAAQFLAPDTAPPGANDWHCRPDPAHPEPVVLLHGLSNQTVTWNTLAPVLVSEGYCVFSTTYGTGQLGPVGAVTPIEESAVQVGAFIDRVLAATGAARVDLVGHSMGGAIPFYYINHLGGASRIDDYVAMAAPFHGTTLSGIQSMFAQVLAAVPALDEAITPQCGPCQFTYGSPYLRKINPDPAVAPDVDFTTIVTRYDQIATPYETGMLAGPNVRNILLQDLCAQDYTEHYELTADPVAIGVVVAALAGRDIAPASCRPVLPFVGPVS